MSPLSMLSFGSTRFAAGTAAGALVLAGLPAGAGATVRTPVAPAVVDHDVRTCAATIDGEQLRLRVRVTFTSPTSNDVKRVQVRATDNRETRIFRNADVNLHQVRISIVKTNGRTAVKRTAAVSPFTVNVVPRGNSIRNVASVSAKARWRIDGHTTVPLGCVFLDE